MLVEKVSCTISPHEPLLTVLFPGKIDVCRGDSGSALQAFDIVAGKAKMFQHGIVSYGVAECGVKVGYPGVYTKVSEYLNWILDNMQ